MIVVGVTVVVEENSSVETKGSPWIVVLRVWVRVLVRKTEVTSG